MPKNTYFHLHGTEIQDNFFIEGVLEETVVCSNLEGILVCLGLLRHEIFTSNIIPFEGISKHKSPLKS